MDQEKPTPSLQQLNNIANEQQQKRNLNGSLDQCKEQLRDAYMNFKDLQQRCVIDMKSINPKLDTNTDEHTVYYFKPDTFLLDDPEKQRLFREDLLRKVSNLPPPPPSINQGDVFHRQFCSIIADKSTPKHTKTMLKQYFHRRQYQLQHLKYKLLCRWAHHCMSSEQIEIITPEATRLFSKLEYTLEQTMSRFERLSQQDYYDLAKPENRPSTRTSVMEEAKYVENFDMPAQSLIREDDIEVFIRGTTYRNKVSKTVNKLMARLKWLAAHKKWEIFEQAISNEKKLQKDNIEKQKKLCERVKKHTVKNVKMNSEMQQTLDEILESMQVRKYEASFLSENDKIKFGWKRNHDEVPRLVGDNQQLKIKIIDLAALYKMTGDIELDKGFSFSYQVTVFFPTYFLKQVARTSFSIYDAFELNVQTDLNQSAHKVDKNLFQDITTNINQVPSDESIQTDLAQQKVIRLKKSDYWLPYVCFTPTLSEWTLEQYAMLNVDNPADKLLQNAFDFLDVNDLATVNRVNEDSTYQHRETVTKLRKNKQHNSVKKISMNTADGEKYVFIDNMNFTNSKNEAQQIEDFLLNNAQDQAKVDSQKSVQFNSLYTLPTHLLQAYFTLRYMRARDFKTKLLYTLNYFRTVQKRIALDLREFATRDRMDGTLAQHVEQSREANPAIISNVQLSCKRKINDDSEIKEGEEDKPKITAFNFDEIKKIRNMADLRWYKRDGLFNNQALSTLPTNPRFHSSNGEHIVYESIAEETDRQAQSENINENSVKLMNRIDFIEIDDKQQEVYVKDDFGIYILHDCVLEDMKKLEEELIKIGSFFIQKSEKLIDPDQRPQPLRDRQDTALDLLEKEHQFQFEKVKLCQVYLECYEHVSDPLEQQKLMQIITDILARRPRLNLQANYFVDAYDGEIECIKKQFELVKTIVDLQISLEKTENNRLQQSLNLSYQLANQYAKNKWEYQDTESLLKAISERREKQQEAAQYTEQRANKEQTIEENENESKDDESSSLNQSKESKSKASSSATARLKERRQSFNDHLSEESGEINSKDGQFMKEEQDQFTKLLGVSRVTIETIYQSYHEKDPTVLELMKEHSQFLSAYEGYPEYLTQLTHHSILSKNKCFSLNSWSQPTGVLDFYDSLDFITKFTSVTQQVQQELYQTLTMWNPSLLTFIDTAVAEYSLKELRTTIQIQEGAVVDYKGSTILEDETILGHSDKVIFYTKEMIADLSTKAKHVLDPFIIAKLDVQSIKYFSFPKMAKHLNKYVKRKEGISGYDYIMQCEKEAIVNIAKEKVQSEDEVKNQGVQNQLDSRKLQVPSLLQTYCNLCELLRIRNEIILTASETAILTLTYKQQCETVGIADKKVVQSEGINFQFDRTDQIESLIDYFEEGPSHMEEIELAIAEFDSSLLSNLNFRNADSLKINLLTAGLEEVRAVLQYQVLHKQALVYAVRVNSLLIDQYQRAQSEIKLLQEHKICIPNPVITYFNIIKGENMPITSGSLKQESQRFRSQASTIAQPHFIQVLSLKPISRSALQKEYNTYCTTAQSLLQEHPHCVQRIARSFKVKLLTKFVNQTALELHADAHKIDLIAAVHRLKKINRVFKFEPKELKMSGGRIELFKCETSELLENGCFYYPNEGYIVQEDQYGMQQVVQVDVLDHLNLEVKDWFGLPSTQSILQCENNKLDLRKFREKQKSQRIQNWGVEDPDDLKKQDPLIIDPEQHLKRMLPTFTPENHSELSKLKLEDLDLKIAELSGKANTDILDYKEAVYCGDSAFAQMSKFYLSLDQLISLEWFTKKLQLNSGEAIYLETALNSGLPYFTLDSYDKRGFDSLKEVQNSDPALKNKTQDIFIEQIGSLRTKQNVAEIAQSFAQIIKNFITQYQKTHVKERDKYLSKTVELKYSQLISSLYKLADDFCRQKQMEQSQQVVEGLSYLTKTEHTKVIYLKPNNYSVKGACVSPMVQPLENQDFAYGQNGDFGLFKLAVEPVCAVSKLEPPQLQLFKTLYQHDSWRTQNPVQFSGQISQNHALPALSYCLLSLSEKDRQLASALITSTKYQANDFLECVYNDHKLATALNEDAYDLEQTLNAKKFILEQSQALLLRRVLICWEQNQLLPNDYQQYEECQQKFREKYFWKCLEQKEEIAKRANSNFITIPSKQHIKELSQKIDQLINDHSISTEQEIAQRDKIVKTLKEEYSQLKKKIALDGFFEKKAEVIVYRNELEKKLVLAAVETLDSEHNALAKCFTTQIPSIQYHIHPFQQFAATFFNQVDPNFNTDVSNKVNAIQEFLTKMRNRSTEVETLTSGPGVVITIKDINEISTEFCRTALAENCRQIKSRCELYQLMQGQYEDQLYVKDQHIKNLETRITKIRENIENIVAARIFEQGNQLIYELDNSNRVLRIFKHTFSKLEQNLTERILKEQFKKFKRQNEQIDFKNKKFQEYIVHIMNMINHNFTEDQIKIRDLLQKKAEAAKNTDQPFQIGAFYPNITQLNGDKGAILPSGFKHYSNCSCYSPDPKQPWPTLELAELDMLSEQEARRELTQMCLLVRKQRVMYKMREMTNQSKYEKNKGNLESKQNNNTLLWEQLQESEKREQSLKKELLTTQKHLAQAQKQIDNLNANLDKIENEKIRLAHSKKGAKEEMKELQDNQKHLQFEERIDSDKLMRMLTKKDQEIQELKRQLGQIDGNQEIQLRRKDSDILKFRKMLLQEQNRNQAVIQKMDQLKMEIKMLEQNDTSVTAIWKKKCLDLYEMSYEIKKENEELRQRCFDLIDQGINMANMMRQSQVPNAKIVSEQIILPDLQNSAKVIKKSKFLAQSDQMLIESNDRYSSFTPHKNIAGSESQRLPHDDINIPSEGLLHTVVGVLKSPQFTQKQRGVSSSNISYQTVGGNKSLAKLKPLPQAMSPNPYNRQANDLRSILGQSDIQSHMVMRNRKQNSDNKIKHLNRKNINYSAQQLYQDQQPYIEMQSNRTSNQSQLIENKKESKALKQLKSVNRFGKPSYEIIVANVTSPKGMKSQLHTDTKSSLQKLETQAANTDLQTLV